MSGAKTIHPVPSDTLLERVRTGSSEALGELYRSYSELVFQLAYRLTASESEAADVVQDVFVGLPRALRSYEEQGAFPGWLKRITARTALMRLRAARRRGEAGSENLERLPARGDAFQVERVALRKVLETMPDSLRTAFILKEVEGYSHAEIAALLGTTVAASAARVSRAWRYLRKKVGTP